MDKNKIITGQGNTGNVWKSTARAFPRRQVKRIIYIIIGRGLDTENSDYNYKKELTLTCPFSDISIGSLLWSDAPSGAHYKPTIVQYEQLPQFLQISLTCMLRANLLRVLSLRLCQRNMATGRAGVISFRSFIHCKQCRVLWNLFVWIMYLIRMKTRKRRWIDWLTAGGGGDIIFGDTNRCIVISLYTRKISYTVNTSLHQSSSSSFTVSYCVYYSAPGC